jgi:ankyrin repeat protein
MYYIRFILYIVVFIGYSSAFSGSYDDFFKALQADDQRTVGQLLARGFDANTRDPQGLHPLILAIRQPSPAVLERLLGAPGLQVEARNRNDESALMLAALAGMTDVCRRLIALDADVNKPGWTPLHYAASGGHAEIVQLLLEHSAYIDAQSPNQSTPLMMAAMYGNTRTLSVLLQAGADASLKNQKGMTALDFAREADSQGAVALIQRHLRILPAN